jgi:LEA14-like dessication related protein
MNGRRRAPRTVEIVGGVLGLLLAAVLTSVPAGAIDSIKQDITISNYEKQVQDLSSQGLTLAFHLRIGNASSQPLFLTRYEYRVVIGQAEYLKLEVPLAPPIRIDRAGETLLSLPLKITYRLLFQAIPSLAGADKANCFLTGTMVFADERKREDKVPFVFGGEFPVFRDPAAALVSLRINDLTVAGADVAFQVRFANANSYELFVDAIRFEASFDDYEVGSGDIPGDKNIEPRGARVFDLPFLISFFEVGQAVHGLLEGTSVPCRFRGEVDVSTVWGKITVPFDVRQTLPIVKPS